MLGLMDVGVVGVCLSGRFRGLGGVGLGWGVCVVVRRNGYVAVGGWWWG